MDPVTHAASGALAMLAMPGRPATRWALPLAAIAAAAPDLDILAASGPLQTLLLHRGITHSLAAAPLMGLLLALIGRPLWRFETRDAWSFGGVWAFMMLLVLLHIWLDALTTYGTLVWLPFSGERLRLNAVYIIDLCMTLPLLWGIWHGLRRERQRRRAQDVIPFPFQNTASLPVSDGKTGVRLALCWSVLLYPALALGCQTWHSQQMQAALSAQGRDIRQLVVLPDAFAPLFWRALYLEKLPEAPADAPAWQAELAPLLPPADRQEHLVVRIQGLDALGRPFGPEESRTAAPAGLLAALSRQSVACRAFADFLLLPVIAPLPAAQDAAPAPGASRWLLHDERFGSQLGFVRRIMDMRPNAGIPFQLMLELEPGNLGPRLLRERLYFSDSRRDSGWQAPRRPATPAFLPWLAGLR